ncbi:MAG TPA: Gldg family protein [Vicinamibacteria bacterium]|nr:Gldg family protein [Vicinamibacteria bacterium]
MKKITPYLGAAGLGFLAAGVLLRLVQPERDRVWASFLIAGLVLTVLYLVNHWQEVLRLAGRRSAREGANSIALAVVVVGIGVAINYIANRHQKRWDFTAARQYTLSEQTGKVLSGLESDLAIVLLDNPTTSRALAARDLLELYDGESEKVTFEVVDPEADPQKALAYQEPGESGFTMGTVLLSSGGRRERATAATEPEITNAILRVLRQDRKKIYFTSGHQEKSIEDTDPNAGVSVVSGKLGGSTYVTETLVLARAVQGDEMRVPADTDALVIAGPKTDFLPEEIGSLDSYLRGGGRVVFLLDPAAQAKTPALDEYLREQGVSLGSDMVVDPLSVPPLYPVVRSYGAHPIVESFSNAISIFPLVRTVERLDSVPQGADVRDLFTSEAESWAETRMDELQARQGPAADQKRGPLPLAVAVTLAGGEAANGADAAKTGAEADDSETKSTSGRFVVVGDSDFIANELAEAPVLNADLFLNMVNWVAEDEDLISVRPREAEDRRIFLSSQQMTNVILFSLLIVPGVILVTGISVWWGRR